MYNTNQMVDRLVLCGITRTEAAQVMGLIDNWRSCNGTEWTVKHLKLIKQTIIGLYGSDTKCISPYVKTKNGHLTGPFRAIEKLFLLGQKKALAAMMIYSSYVSAELTKEQKQKFVKACTAPAYTGEWSPSVTRYVVKRTVKGPGPTPYGGWPTTNVDVLSEINFDIEFQPLGTQRVGEKFAPDYRGKSFCEREIGISVQSFLRTGVYRDLYFCGNGFFPEDWEFLSGKVLGINLPAPIGDVPYPVGKVSVLQEPGFKARFIANPNRVVQHLLKPLGDFLFNCLRALPNDCTFDQDKAVRRLTEVIATSHNSGPAYVKPSIYCFDLSNATDLFPLEVQECVVMNIAKEKGCLDYILPFLRVFRHCARQPWYFQKEQITWSRGQPLGLYPSFAMFALSHNFLLYELQSSVGGDFCVLGDDVYVVGDELAKAYKNLMKELGVEINMSKSITAPNVAEFAGKVILQSDVLVPYKWRQTSLKSVRDFLVMWGMEAIPLLPRHLRDWATLIGSMPEPLGLGYNPDGLPLDIRVLGLWSLYCDTDVPALSRDKVSLADVLKAMPEGSTLRYDTESAISRPVRLPLKDLCHYLSSEDLRAFYQMLIDKGSISRDEAVEEIREFGYNIESTPSPFEKDIRDIEAMKASKKLVDISKQNLMNRIMFILFSSD